MMAKPPPQSRAAGLTVEAVKLNGASVGYDVESAGTEVSAVSFEMETGVCDWRQASRMSTPTTAMASQTTAMANQPEQMGRPPPAM